MLGTYNTCIRLQSRATSSGTTGSSSSWMIFFSLVCLFGFLLVCLLCAFKFVLVLFVCVCVCVCLFHGKQTLFLFFPFLAKRKQLNVCEVRG